ncbi:MAG: FAD:protein FMN transferase [Bacillota bacterium]
MKNFYRRMRPFLGTFVEIGTFADDPLAEQAVNDAFVAIELVHKTLGFHNAESELSKLNSAEGQEVVLSPISIVALRLARALTRISDGLFNCTTGGALVRENILPRHSQAGFLTEGMASDIHIQGRKVRLNRPVLITLDGFAKGYAVDLAIKALRKAGLDSGWVNAGGDLRVFGEIILPLQRREADESLTDLGRFQEIAVATSMVSEQYSPQFPGKIHGIGGVPPQVGVWTVSAPSTWLADGLTKVACLAPEKERQKLLAKMGGTLLMPKGME